MHSSPASAPFSFLYHTHVRTELTADYGCLVVVTTGFHCLNALVRGIVTKAAIHPFLIRVNPVSGFRGVHQNLIYGGGVCRGEAKGV
jgi:hypothetical protein